jgi:hypothetical protein
MQGLTYRFDSLQLEQHLRPVYQIERPRGDSMPSPCSTPVPSPCAPAIPAGRILDNFTHRYNTATAQAVQAVPPQPTNGDEALPDKCGTYTKCIKQASPGKVDLTAFAQFRSAINSGDFADFQNLTLGGSRTQNNPMGSYAYSFVGADASQFGLPEVPAPPALASEEYATELIDLYWCSLLRDVAFIDYHDNPIAHAAAKELTNSVEYKGPKHAGKVTPELLFRGNFPGEAIGPYISQFFATPTNLGALPFSQQYVTYKPNVDYMTDQGTWWAVQNGVGTGFTNQKLATPLYLHDGRGLAAYTHVDELYQAYFTAYLVLSSIGAPVNPGSPYVVGGLPSKKQNGFGTFGGPDFAAVLAQVAKLALNTVWYQKWVVHLRHRPESGAGLIHLINRGSTFDAQPLPRVFNSQALHQSSSKYGSDLLSQPFPEGSPAHPAYPTGHGTVGGACITILKFFFDGDYVLYAPQESSSDGTTLGSWDPMDHPDYLRGNLTVNGELHKLAHNVTFGHGLHGGIHWRSDSDWSMTLGEAVAIRFLQDLACTYKEPFSITFTKLDGTPQTITNM